MRGALLRFAVGATALVAFHAASASALEDIKRGPAFANATAVSTCDTDGIGVDYLTTFDMAGSRHVVTAVVMTDFESACAGQRVAVTVLDVDDNPIASGAAHVDGDAVTIPLSPLPPAAAVSRTSVLIGR